MKPSYPCSYLRRWCWKSYSLAYRQTQWLSLSSEIFRKVLLDRMTQHIGSSFHKSGMKCILYTLKDFMYLQSLIIALLINFSDLRSFLLIKNSSLSSIGAGETHLTPQQFVQYKSKIIVSFAMILTLIFVIISRP